MSVYSRKRISAFITAAGNGWKVGDVLVSAKWKAPRIIARIDQNGVGLSGNGGMYYGATFPPDVCRAALVRVAALEVSDES